MKLTFFEIFSLEWAQACFDLNPNAENKNRLNEIKKIIKQKKSE